jgi:lipopolysaccharide export system protein LptA
MVRLAAALAVAAAICVLVSALADAAAAQEPGPRPAQPPARPAAPEVPGAPADTLEAPADTLEPDGAAPADTLGPDTTAAGGAAGRAAGRAAAAVADVSDPLYQRLAGDARPGQVVYRADRLTLYPSDRVILLSGSAEAVQDSTVLAAGRITYAREENLVQALGNATVTRGSSTLAADTLVLDQGSGNVATFGPSRLDEPGAGEVTGEGVRYSMDRRAGFVAGGRTQYDVWYLEGQAMNKIGERTFVVEEGTFTTDPQEPPDYHFSSEHIKLRRDDVILARPVVLYVSDVPILYLPWYLEPLGTGRKSGILRPKIGLNTLVNAPGSERNVQDLGYYWALSDFMDAQLALDWFSRSRTILRADYRYSVRYLLRGSAHFERVWNRTRNSEDTLLRVAHDHEFDPSTQLRVDANVSTSRQFFEDNSFDPDRLLQRALRSNASFSRRFTWGNLTAGAFSDFKLQQERTDFKIPSLQLTLNTRPLFPGSRLDRNWKQNLQIGASTSFDWDYATQGDSVSGRDSTVLNEQTSVTRVTLSGPFDLLGFIKTTPSVDFSETLFQNRALPDSIVEASDESFGHLETLGATLSLAANVFRIFQGGPGPVTKMRHTTQPQLSLRWQPETTPREELPFGFPGGGGTEVLNATFAISNNLDLKVRETRATARRREEEEERLRRAREAGLLRSLGELTLEEQALLDSMAVADSLGELEEEARDDSVDAARERGETGEDGETADTAGAIGADSAAVEAGEEQPDAPRARRRPAPPARDEEEYTERTVRLLSVRNRLGFDFVRNAEPNRLGFSNFSTDVSSQASDAFSVNVSLNHDLVDERRETVDSLTVVDEVFDPFLSSVTTVVRFGGGSGLRGERLPRDARSFGEEVTDAEAGQGAFSDGVGLGDAPPGFEAIQSSSLGRWEVDLTHSLSRSRTSDARQSVRFGTSFNPTENWHLRYRSGYDITGGRFQDQSVSLVRDLNRWQATLNLNVFPSEPQDRVLVELAVFLRDIPDLRIPYRARRE